MGVRAKMYVTEVGRTQYGGKVALRVVSRGDDNKEWAQATPTGDLTLGIRNDLAFEQFDVGQEFYVDLTPVPTEHVGQEGMG